MLPISTKKAWVTVCAMDAVRLSQQFSLVSFDITRHLPAYHMAR